MRIGVLGTGMVGETIAGALARRGHHVHMGARERTNEKAAAWAAAHGGSHGTFADAAAHGEVVFNCTAGKVSLSALGMAGAENLRGKVLVDVANPLDFSTGTARLWVCNDDSLAEQIQRAFPDARVVKALNTVNCSVMVDAARIPGDHDTFVCGDDAEAKAVVSALLREDFGWRVVLDLGPLSAARATEAYVLLWMRMFQALGTPDFNLHVVRPTPRP